MHDSSEQMKRKKENRKEKEKKNTADLWPTVFGIASFIQMDLQISGDVK